MKNIIINTNSKNSSLLPLYFHTVCEYYNQGVLNRTRGTSFHQILAVIEGEGILTCGEKTYRLKKGNAFYVSPLTPISYSGNDEFITAFLTVKGTAVTSLCKYYGYGNFFMKNNIDTDKFREDIAEITAEYYGQNRDAVISSLCYSFYINFFENSDKELSIIEKVTSYLEKNFSKKISLKTIADAHNISVSKLCHDFKKEYNCSVFEHIINLRLSYAKNYLAVNPNTKSKTVAQICGFDDPSYFCKAYRKKYGSNPRSETLN